MGRYKLEVQWPGMDSMLGSGLSEPGSSASQGHCVVCSLLRHYFS